MVQAWRPEWLAESPWFASIQPALRFAQWPRDRWPSLAQYQALLDRLPVPPCAGSGRPLRVVAQHPAGAEDYEARIFARGELATRSANWHDCFNVLAWASFPLAKAALNARHCVARGDSPVCGRSPEQDALTQFDESGVVVAAGDAALLDLIRAFRWRALFWERRVEVAANAACYLFGHGLMEKALHPYVGLTGKAVLMPVAAEFFQAPLAARLAAVDRHLAACLADRTQFSSPRALAPLPLLGWPGFSSLGESETFYARLDYFRPGRRA